MEAAPPSDGLWAGNARGCLGVRMPGAAKSEFTVPTGKKAGGGRAYWHYIFIRKT